MENSSKPHVQYFLYFPRKRDGLFPIIITHDVTDELFKKASQEVAYKDAEKRPIYIRDFEKRFQEIVKDKSGSHNFEYTIHNKISEDELEYLIGEKLS